MTSPSVRSNLLAGISIVLSLRGKVHGFMTPPTNVANSLPRTFGRTSRQVSSLDLYNPKNSENNDVMSNEFNKKMTATNAVASVALITALTFSPLPSSLSSSNAYEALTSDFASDAVEDVVKSLKESNGNQDKVFQTYENIADIITEGKGIGGVVNYKGVTLERGYVADEDTSIYNPGLTLLTEGEKNKLVDAIMQSRQTAIDKDQWSEKNQLAYEYLKLKLDPYHMTELRGYLRIVPALVGVLYLAVLGVQQFARDLFPVAYIGAVLAIFAPAILLVLSGQ